MDGFKLKLVNEEYDLRHDFKDDGKGRCSIPYEVVCTTMARQHNSLSDKTREEWGY